MSWRVHSELMCRFLARYFDAQILRMARLDPVETEEQFAFRMGWPLEPEGETP